jgi:hypothetical protein
MAWILTPSDALAYPDLVTFYNSYKAALEKKPPDLATLREFTASPATWDQFTKFFHGAQDPTIKVSPPQPNILAISDTDATVQVTLEYSFIDKDTTLPVTVPVPTTMQLAVAEGRWRIQTFAKPSALPSALSQR